VVRIRRGVRQAKASLMMFTGTGHLYFSAWSKPLPGRFDRFAVVVYVVPFSDTRAVSRLLSTTTGG
jgi:hypothetical protein